MASSSAFLDWPPYKCALAAASPPAQSSPPQTNTENIIEYTSSPITNDMATPTIAVEPPVQVTVNSAEHDTPMWPPLVVAVESGVWTTVMINLLNPNDDDYTHYMTGPTTTNVIEYTHPNTGHDGGNGGGGGSGSGRRRRRRNRGRRSSTPPEVPPPAFAVFPDLRFTHDIGEVHFRIVACRLNDHTFQDEWSDLCETRSFVVRDRSVAQERPSPGENRVLNMLRNTGNFNIPPQPQ